jgi:gliding motility-associated-like protein
MILNYRSLLFILVLAACHHRGLAQGGTWTWLKGTSAVASVGNYGTKGVASASNEPPARYEASYWTDLQGNFWMFGGSIPIGTGAFFGNDLWKYDVATNMWTWVNGSNVVSAPNPAGVFGTKGIPSVNNYPSARGFGSSCWTDNAGDLWLYAGGGATSVFNDLWRYNIATNQWTWMFQASSAPVYGTKGVATASNNPGALGEVNCGWVDNNNCLWTFGGTNINGDAVNTLWKYDISSGLWTWMSGSSTPRAAGSYGVKGVEAAGNEPPARFSYSRWKDGNGHFYIFGGGNVNGNGNDVWRYRPSVNRWTWVSGTNVPADPGNYPAQTCVFSDTHYPASRMENTTPPMAGSTCASALWMFGGSGQFGGSDLWLFRTDSMKWALISGSSTYSTGIYGTQGVPSTANIPPSRAGHCNWVDKKNNLWVFGGSTSAGFRNDLWRFTPDSNCIDMRALFDGRLTPPDTTLCIGDSSIMSIGTHSTVFYTPATGVSANGDSSKLVFKPLTTTSYLVAVEGHGCIASDTLRFTISVNARDSARLKAPVPLALCKNDTAIMSVNPGWTISVTPIVGVKFRPSGGSDIKFFPTALSTQYRVVATSNVSCIYPDTIRFTITRDTVTQRILPMTDTMLCPGDTATYLLNQKVDNWSISPATGFSVSKDSSVFKFFPLQPTLYRFVGIKTKGCRPRDTIYFRIHPSELRADFVLTPKLTSTNAARFTLRNTSGGATKYQWFVNGSPFSTDVNPTYTATDSGRYCFLLLATDTLNCADTALDCAEVVGQVGAYLPSAFSPNGDGVNDILFVRGRGIRAISLAVFNRWGQKVFETNEISKGWDGRYKGKEVDVEAYSYVLKATFVDGTDITKAGNVTIVK